MANTNSYRTMWWSWNDGNAQLQKCNIFFMMILIVQFLAFVEGFSTVPTRQVSSTLYSSFTSGADMTNSLKKEFQRDEGILYKKSVFSQANITTIRSDIMKTTLGEETASSVANYRLGATLAEDTNTVKLLENGNLMELIHKIFGKSYCLSKEIPIEVRVYEKPGAGMEWHVDDVLYDPPQIEVVVTIENTSDCQTMWKSKDGSISTSLETDVNSVILLQAGGVCHRVSPMKRGRRVILKCAYIDKHAMFYRNEMVKQFDSKPKRAKKRKRGR